MPGAPGFRLLRAGTHVIVPVNIPAPGKYWEFWQGMRRGIPLCCIIWFIDIHSVRKYGERKEYQDRMRVMTGNAGIVLCPECAARTLGSRIRTSAPSW